MNNGTNIPFGSLLRSFGLQLQSLFRNLLLFGLLIAPAARASENVPHRPFAEWADIPAAGQLIAGAVYEESESYHIYAGGRVHDVTYRAPDGEKYGIDINQGYFALQYGITERWAADLNVGATT